MFGVLLVDRRPRHPAQAGARLYGWDVQMHPGLRGVERHNTVVGGASLWVLSGKTDEEYKAAATYLAFLATKEEQQFLSGKLGLHPGHPVGL
ncbi:MAG: hypothetical protein U5N55_08510 [Cypionkella sp.]|nr:hypothetical protein [Cypionkella sp.]